MANIRSDTLQMSFMKTIKKRGLKIEPCGASARPEVRGTADVGWRSLFPLPFNPPRTHSRIYHHMCLQTNCDSGVLKTSISDHSQ